MYVGGMGGTGKSRVLHAVQSMFDTRGERTRMIVLAPTGTAAALVKGSTYHYVLGINDLKRKDGEIDFSNLGEVKERLLGVDYIFMDEVSMLSCYETCLPGLVLHGQNSAPSDVQAVHQSYLRAAFEPPISAFPWLFFIRKNSYVLLDVLSIFVPGLTVSLSQTVVQQRVLSHVRE